jgi:hypothetical protein
MEIAKLILEYIKVLIWPIIFVIFWVIYRREILALSKEIKEIVLPGGTTLKRFPQQLKEAKELSIKVKEEKSSPQKPKKVTSIPLNEANARMLSLGLAPSPSGLELSYYRSLAEQDPNLALAGLRMEIEILLKNVAKGFKVPINDIESVGIIATRLRDKSAITSNQYELIRDIMGICNAAVHGQRITADQAEQILDIATVLRDQYISWLSWGFSKKA